VTWAVVGSPSNARITKDIPGWERVCDKITEAKGTIVLDENFRTGRRVQKMHGEGDRMMNTASKLGPHTQTDRGTCPGVRL